GARRRRGGRAAVPEARPGVPLLQWRGAGDPGRFHAGQLPDARRQRGALRCAHPAVPARDARNSAVTRYAIGDVQGCDEELGALLEWLLTRPLAHAEGPDLMVHAGLVPQWTVALTLSLALEVGSALRRDPRALFDRMYGNEPDRWHPLLAGMQRLRFVINVLTRLRVCTADGRVDFTMKGEPPPPPSPLRPWFAHAQRESRDARIIFGHWSALGLVREHG